MYRKICLVLVLGILMSIDIYAQNSETLVVPEAVKNSMLMRFPQTQKVPVTWSKDGANFKGSLVVMEKPAFAIFDVTGKIIRVERTMHYSFLSKKIVSQLNSQYPGNEILDVYEVTDAAGLKTYKTTFKYTKSEVFKEDGSIVK